ncbi:MAG: hypothetical protein GF329_11445 [Candidatus Lokiarchaeota archaeon]|nr:hypothetical protein [Candidatus Lokiarchaeota archaeon]
MADPYKYKGWLIAGGVVCGEGGPFTILGGVYLFFSTIFNISILPQLFIILGTVFLIIGITSLVVGVCLLLFGYSLYKKYKKGAK